MNNQPDKQDEKITIYAPSNSDSSVQGALLSVEIKADEDVEWIWTHLDNGESAVTGYNIIQK